MPLLRFRTTLIVTVGLFASGCAQVPPDREPAPELASSGSDRPAAAEARRSMSQAAPASARPVEDDSVVRTAMDATTAPVGAPHSAGVGGRPLQLEEAKSLAVQLNPQVAQDLAAIKKAEGGEEIAYSGYLPTVLGSYSFQAFSSDTGFVGTRGRFPVLPVRGFGPGTQDFHVTEAQLRWNVFQFGRQIAKHGQSMLRVEIAKLQYQRSLQAAEFEVSQAYFRVLEARATQVRAEQSVVNAKAILEEAGDLLKQGVITPEEVLRAEVESAVVHQLLTTARSETEVSVAGLNRSIGLEVNAPTEVAERREEPGFDLSLEDCLRLAAEHRPEIAVVRHGVAIADAEIRVAKSDFLPTFSIQSSLSNVTGTGVQNSNVLGGGAFATLELYTGGKRRGQLEIANAEARAAVAQAKAVVDGVAYETNVAYRRIEDARERITQSRTALTQARENVRLVRNRLKTGDANPTELIGAETTLIRTEQSYNSAYYDYQVAIARLEFAVGGPIARPGPVVSPPEAPAAATPEPATPPPPATGPSPFEPAPGRPPSTEGARLPSILPQPGLEAIPSPFDEFPPFGPSRGRPYRLPTSPLDRLIPAGPRPEGVPGLARPPYESNPLSPGRPPGSGP